MSCFVVYGSVTTSRAAGKGRQGSKHMITAYDYFILAFYFIFIIVIGLVFRRQSKNTSDYFRAGGAMPW